MASDLQARRRQLVGTALAGAGAFGYGVTVVVGRSLARNGLTPTTVLGARFSGGALLLLGLLAVTGRSLLPVPGERAKIFLLGLCGYGIESTFFFMGLQRGTAAAVTLLFYSFPALVTLLEIPLGRGRPSRQVLAALGLSATGAVLIVASGAEVSISRAGIACAFGSALTFSLYLITSDRVVVRTGPMTAGAWVAAGTALFHLSRGLATGTLHSPTGHWPLVLANALATAAAFSLMYAALSRLGPSRTAVVMTLEAFFAIVLAAAFLEESLGVVQVGGGLAILAGAVLIGLSRPPGPLDGGAAVSPPGP